VLLLTAIVLAVFFLPAPWNGLVVALGVLAEAGEAVFGIWYSRRRGSAADAERMIAATVRVIEPCRPRGLVSYKGERWNAVCAEGADIGERVQIAAIDGSTLVVERIEGS
jgi:membrane protein implicated in regulation of membrane protease activity